jgi:hypothetical protein
VVHIEDHYVVVVGGRQAVIAWDRQVAERIAAAITAKLCEESPEPSGPRALPRPRG